MRKLNAVMTILVGLILLTLVLMINDISVNGFSNTREITHSEQTHREYLIHKAVDGSEFTGKELKEFTRVLKDDYTIEIKRQDKNLNIRDISKYKNYILVCKIENSGQYTYKFQEVNR